jgi:hypothetical protein
MKSTIKLVLFVSLFSSVVFADGDMTNGGKTCTSNCLVATEPTEKETIKTESEDSILMIVQKYLISIFG